jgi:GTP cyclohydrolase I
MGSDSAKAWVLPAEIASTEEKLCITQENIVSRLWARVRAAGLSAEANASIWAVFEDGDLDRLEEELERRIAAVIEALLIDREKDPHSRDTPRRLAKLYLREVFAGRYADRPLMADFPNGKRLDELYTLGPIAVRSACAHHLCPVTGQLWVGVIPNKRIVGISKFSRLARWILARPQVQEDAIVQLADEIEGEIDPRGLALVMKATHSCMTWRGVNEHDTTMVTNVMRGIMREAPTSRAEFFAAIQAQGFIC